MFNMGTHCYVGTRACGCAETLVRDTPEFPRDVAKDVAEMIKNGLSVQRLPHAEACVLFDYKCAEHRAS